jgi:hypothetical protein
MMSSAQAVCFVVFLVGFITVLCVGNYFRAKRAQERQRQRRLAKLAVANGVPNAAATAYYEGNGTYEAPEQHLIPQQPDHPHHNGVQA